MTPTEAEHAPCAAIQDASRTIVALVLPAVPPTDPMTTLAHLAQEAIVRGIALALYETEWAVAVLQATERHLPAGAYPYREQVGEIVQLFPIEQTPCA